MKSFKNTNENIESGNNNIEKMEKLFFIQQKLIDKHTEWLDKLTKDFIKETKYLYLMNIAQLVCILILASKVFL